MAHDIQMSVAHYVEKELKMINSFDTWHGNIHLRFEHGMITSRYTGTKGVGRALKVITEGAAKWQNKKWFPDLVDKRMHGHAMYT